MATGPALALYQPDIPQNTGTLLRLGACLDVPVHVIEPAGFAFGDKALKRSGMDYLDLANLTRHINWDAFLTWRTSRRLVLMTTAADDLLYDFSFQSDDIILMGRESAGVPENVHEMADARLKIPMRQNARSLNMAISATMAITEALRQLDAFPTQRAPHD